MHGLRIRYWDRNQDLDGKVKILILILMMPRFVNGGGMPVVPVVPLSKYLAPPILPRGAAAAARGKSKRECWKDSRLQEKQNAFLHQGDT